jgi:hypothetical protein
MEENSRVLGGFRLGYKEDTTRDGWKGTTPTLKTMKILLA